MSDVEIRQYYVKSIQSRLLSLKRHRQVRDNLSKTGCISSLRTLASILVATSHYLFLLVVTCSPKTSTKNLHRDAFVFVSNSGSWSSNAAGRWPSPLVVVGLRLLLLEDGLFFGCLVGLYLMNVITEFFSIQRLGTPAAWLAIPLAS